MTKQTTSSDNSYAHLRANAAVQRQTTVDRLNRAIETLQASNRPVNTFTIKEVSGLDYMSYYRNPEALALFRTHSTHLRQEREKQQAKGRRSKRKGSRLDETLHQVPIQPRDPSFNYKKPELIAKLRAVYAEREQIEQRLQTEHVQLEQRYHTLLQEHMMCGVTIAKLEAKQTEFQTFMEQFRSALRREEHDPHS
jgi:hypothetical protein